MANRSGKRLQPRTRFALGLLAFFAALWLLWPTPVVYPFKIFVVFLHELSHALAALATGGEVEAITLDPREGGATYTYGGNAFVMLSAGYLGSLLWGMGMLAIARARPKLAGPTIQALAVLTWAVTALYVRNLFGIVFGILFGFALLFAGRRLQRDQAVALLTALGLTSSLYALLDIRSDILQRPGVESDARLLAELTGIPTLFWGGLWATIALVSSLWLLHRLWRGGGRLR
jgi:hypothetical protein